MRVQIVTACALLLAAGCAHSSGTGKSADGKDATDPRSSDAATRSGKATPKTPPGHPPLAASPSELMNPDSQRKISQALESKGFAERDDLKGEQLSAALRKFQESQGLAATGFPDHETLRRLGIDAKEADQSLESFSGTKPSDDAGKGGSGAPPKDDPAKANGEKGGH